MHGTIRCYSHHFVVRDFKNLPGRLVQRFLKDRLVQYERASGHEPKPTRTFAARKHDQSEYRIHINCLESFRQYMKEHGRSDYFIESTEPMYSPAIMSFQMKSDMVVRDTQVPIMEYLTNRSDINAKLVTLQTGQGKTFTFLKALSVLQTRGVMVMRPKFIGSWLNALYGKDRVTELDPSEVMVIQGSAQLSALINDALDEVLDAKLIIISNKTLLNYIKQYEEGVDVAAMYGCEPVELWRIIGAGLVGRDEGHLDFHFNFKLDCYMHVPYTTTLSATFEAEDQFLHRMQVLQYPMNTRAPRVELIKICDVIGVKFAVRYPTEIRFTIKGRKDYNHARFEETVLKSRKNAARWTGLVSKIVGYEYVRIREEGQRYIVFVSRVDMADAVVRALRTDYPILNIVRFAQGDELADALVADIVVTTVMSGSTAIDIPGLIGGLLTTAIGAKESNIQLLGRVRAVKQWPNVRPRFIYLWTDTISASRSYHLNKMEYFRGRVLSHSVQESGVWLQ